MNKYIRTQDYWEIDHTVWERVKLGNDATDFNMVEYAYLINRFTGEVRKVKIG